MHFDIYNFCYGAASRVKDGLKGTGIYHRAACLRQEQYLSHDEIRERQLLRLQSLLARAQKHSPYYRELFKRHAIDALSVKSISDLARIPLLKRENLQDNYQRILCEDALNAMPNSSGGSTGNPVHFYQDQHYWSFAASAELLFLDWMGIRKGDRTAVLWGTDRDFNRLSRYEKMKSRASRKIRLNSFSMTSESIGNFVARMNNFKPEYIYGYASSLFLVAKYVNSTRRITFAPVAIRSSAETLYQFQRAEIEKAFGARVYDYYGSREVNNIAVECSFHDGLHILASGRIVEIVDDSGKEVPDGQVGQIAITDLTNRTFPFIRYLNGDVGTKSGRSCLCGRGYPLIEKLHGRVSDMIVVNGQYVHGEFFTHLFYNKRGVRQFQVIQEKEDFIRVLVVGTQDQCILSELAEEIRQKVGREVKIEIEVCDQIHATQSGKHRFTISNVARKDFEVT